MLSSVCLPVCLSVTKCILSEQVNSKCPHGDDFTTFSPYTDPIPKTPQLLHRRCWCHLANTLKYTVNKRTANIFTSGIAIVSMIYSHLRQRRTIGSFLSTAGRVGHGISWTMDKPISATRLIFVAVLCSVSDYPIDLIGLSLRPGLEERPVILEHGGVSLTE